MELMSCWWIGLGRRRSGGRRRRAARGARRLADETRSFGGLLRLKPRRDSFRADVPPRAGAACPVTDQRARSEGAMDGALADADELRDLGDAQPARRFAPAQTPVWHR